MSFIDLGLEKPLIKALDAQGYTEPTPIQLAAITPILDGCDIMATAQTGTGKTAAFTLPLLQTLAPSDKRGRAPRVLVLTPTRELAAQVQASIDTYGRFLSHESAVVFGGVKINPQIRQLKQGIDFLVATPGRLLDLHQQRALDLRSIEVLVLDEADRMLDMGFIHAIRNIQSKLPRDKQTLMFSATFSREIRELAGAMLTEPVEVDVAPRNATAAKVEQRVIALEKTSKAEAVQQLYEDHGGAQSLVFTRTKHGANKLVKVLNKAGIGAEAIHGNKSQAHRTRVLDAFKRDKLGVLVATDIASRGLDIMGLPMVINYELPDVPEDYVHRIGRTGRAGHDGLAFSLVCADEVKQLHAIEKLTGNEIDRTALEGFDELELPRRRQPGSGQSRGQGGGNSRNRRRGGSRRRAA